MSGLLGGLLTAVGIVGAIVTGGTLGIVAGALMAASFAAQHGWLGSGAQKFAESGIGQGITAAVGLASGAMALDSAVSAASSAAVDATTSATFDATNASLSQAGTSAVDSQIGTVGDISAQSTTDVGSIIQQAQGVVGSVNSSATATASNAVNATVDDARNVAGGMQSVQAGGVSAAQAATAGNGTDVTGTTANQVLNEGGGPGLLHPEGQPLSAAANAPVPGSVTDTGAQINTAGGPLNSSTDPGMSDPNAGPNAGPTQGGGGSSGSGIGGFLKSAGQYLKDNSGVAVAGGEALAGLAKGIGDQKAMQEQIAAQQWGNMQWMNPQQVAQLNQAAAAPITVPSGYLNRANAVRNMLTSGSGAPPPSATGGAAPPPAAMAPVGMSSGPVPLAALPATPRGGM